MPKTRHEPFVNAVTEPVYRTATYFFQNSDEVADYHLGKKSVGRYARYDNPNWLSVETTFAAMEQTEAALLFPSGMSAITTTLLSVLEAGDSLVFSGKGYRNIRNLCANYLTKFGVKVQTISTGSQTEFDASLAALDTPPKAIFLENPSNPHLNFIDIQNIKKQLGEETVLIVDSTLASPVNYLPSKLGADIVIHSASKYIGGHTDIMAGLVAGKASLLEDIRATRNVTGAIASPETASLLGRSLATLQLRMEHLNSQGLALAQALDALPFIKHVGHPFLPSHANYDRVQAQMTGGGGLVLFELDLDDAQTQKFIDHLKLPFMGTNFGGLVSMVEQVTHFTYFTASPEERADLGLNPAMVRYSIGSDPVEDVVEDIVAAYEKAAK